MNGRKAKGYLTPMDIGTVRLVGWRLPGFLSQFNIFLFLLLLGSRLVCELGPVSIPKDHGALRRLADKAWNEKRKHIH